ncbi:reactive intermediate/imine deaminase [Actinomadura pelletieri DSM 43383]|uniref:Reactive intermediate/imine deaminase n=1 Tax=Actinomadura pelletieri DSM 43383 TaxID=1120940 RepID=A0A495QZM0_9ACTN|nr:Rid family detoxifying hydrolase [Actinomadura pelletieri]RKS79517.1 reactive intermediate/imine deaminase [Actinomadura pelletieri DSM 43383]
MSKREIRSEAAPAPLGTYSQAIVVGDFLYTSGMGPNDPKTGESVGGDVAQQTRQVLANLKAILAEHGLGLDDVVKSTVHLQDLHRDFAAYDKVYREHFTEPYPVRTTVGSDLMNILVEIDFVAYKKS